MRKIVLHRHFLKDLKKLKVTKIQVKKLEKYKDILKTGEKLPKEFKDHKLIGNYTGFREFHIGGDLVVVYFLDETKNQVIFARIGSHNAVFKL